MNRECELHKEFENWILTTGSAAMLATDINGFYVNAETQMKWGAWKTAWDPADWKLNPQARGCLFLQLRKMGQAFSCMILDYSMKKELLDCGGKVAG